MAEKKFILPYSTLIEVVVSKNGRVRKKVMTYGEALNLKKTKGWKYQNFQVGFCTIPATEENTKS